MSRARGARKGCLAASVIMGIASTSPTPLQASSGIVVVVSEQSLRDLARLESEAKKAPSSERRQKWFELGAHTLRALSSNAVPEHLRGDLEDVLRSALTSLPATDVVALAGRGSHPLLSEAFVRTVRRDGGPRGVSMDAEVAAEARDAVAAWAGSTPKSLLDVLKSRRALPAPGAGGTQASVYSILVLSESPVDSSNTEFRFRSGLRAGIAQGAGVLTDRFQVTSRSPDGPETERGPWVVKSVRDARAAVTLVTGGASLWSAASALCLERGWIVADARGNESMDPEPLSGDPLSAGVQEIRLSHLPVESIKGSGESRSFQPFQLRPTPEVQAETLFRSITRRSAVRKIVVAIPSRGGSERLARTFAVTAHANGVESPYLVYEPGRRDYAPEVTQFLSMGAQGILFAGPAEETAEWLSALAARKASPLLLGTTELDPAGFHARVRSRLENAVVVGDDWEDVQADVVTRLRSFGEDGTDVGFRRGFRTGWMLSRAVLEGAFTPSSLHLAIAGRSAGPTGSVYSAAMVVGPKATPDVMLPVFTVQKGALVPVSP